MSIYVKEGSATTAISDERLRELVKETIAKSGKKLRRLLLLPPDHTRLNSRAGRITEMIWEEYHDQCQIDIMPALGTHSAMNDAQLEMMFGKRIPKSLFKVHDWRNGVVTLGKASSELLRELSGGKLDYEVQVQADKILFEDYDLILSIGQVVPHEVVGLANYTKNIMVGVGGSDMINKSHFLGASYGMERIMGVIDTPVRRLFNYGVHTYLADLPIVYVLTVMAKDSASGAMAMRGLFIGDDDATYAMGARLSQQVNLDLMDEPEKKVVVYLDPEEFRTTWLGNKAVYRTRMMVADDGDLIILAPGLKQFGEDPINDRLIRKLGYVGTPKILAATQKDEELQRNLGVVAHLMHGSSEGRFRITYCHGSSITKEEIESIGYIAGDLDSAMKRYNPKILKDGVNILPNGERVFYISNPALGLWALKSKFV
jgi:nickel-dependent lactate racemase